MAGKVHMTLFCTKYFNDSVEAYRFYKENKLMANTKDGVFAVQSDENSTGKYICDTATKNNLFKLRFKTIA